MAALDYFLANAVSDGWRRLETSAQTAATLADGWVVSTGSTNHSEYEVTVERAASTFTGTTVPDGSLDTTLKDAFRSVAALDGSFASANWVFHFVVRAVTNGGAQDGRVRFRLIKANADGSNATEITAAQQQASEVLNVSTSADFDSTLTFNPGAFSISNQYLFIQIAWERTGAGGMTSSDIAFRTGSSSTVGTRITTADFTANQTLAAGTPTVTFSAPTATRIATRTLTAGAPVVVFTAPAATLSAAGGPQTLVAGTPVITFSAPAATRLATKALVAGTPTVVLSAPAMNLLPGGVTISLGVPVVTFMAPSAVLLGGGAGGGFGEWSPMILYSTKKFSPLMNRR